MKPATQKEYNQVSCYPGATKRIIEGKRDQMVIWSYNGTEIATKVTIFLRGKVQSVSWQVNPEYLKSNHEN